MSKKILIVDFNGTAPLYTFYLTKGFTDLGCTAKILGNNRPEYFLTQPESELYINCNVSNKAIKYFLNWIYLFRKAKKQDIIIVQWLQLLKHTSIEVFLFRAIQKLNRNTYYLAHNLVPHRSNPKINNRYNKLYYYSKKILVHTESAKANLNLRFKKGKNILVIKHGYFYSDINKDMPSSIKNLMIITGFISEYKGIEDAIDAIAIIEKKGISLNLHIQGKGEKNYVNTLKKLCNDLGVNHRVVINPNFISTTDLVDLYKSAFCSILPYKKIEQSGVIFTSLGLNTPVICYDVGGFSLIVNDKINGRIVEKDNVSDLSDALLWAYRNQKQLDKNIINSKKDNFWKKSASLILKNSEK